MKMRSISELGGHCRPPGLHRMVVGWMDSEHFEGELSACAEEVAAERKTKSYLR